MGHGEGLPAEPPQSLEENEDFLKKAHHVLLEVGGSTHPPYWRWVGAFILFPPYFACVPYDQECVMADMHGLTSDL